MSCSPMHVMYAFFSENVFVPKMSCGSCVTVWHSFLHAIYSFVHGNYFSIQFLDSWKRVWDCIEVVSDAHPYDCVYHMYFLFHGSWACD